MLTAENWSLQRREAATYNEFMRSAISLAQPVDCKSQILHKNRILVRPDPPSMGGGAGQPDSSAKYKLCHLCPLHNVDKCLLPNAVKIVPYHCIAGNIVRVLYNWWFGNFQRICQIYLPSIF